MKAVFQQPTRQLNPETKVGNVKREIKEFSVYVSVTRARCQLREGASDGREGKGKKRRVVAFSKNAHTNIARIMQICIIDPLQDTATFRSLCFQAFQVGSFFQPLSWVFRLIMILKISCRA